MDLKRRATLSRQTQRDKLLEKLQICFGMYLFFIFFIQILTSCAYERFVTFTKIVLQIPYTYQRVKTRAAIIIIIIIVKYRGAITVSTVCVHDIWTTRTRMML